VTTTSSDPQAREHVQAKEGNMTAQSQLDENKRIVREFIETAFNKHQADRAADYMTSDIKWHGGTLGTVEGRENFAPG